MKELNQNSDTTLMLLLKQGNKEAFDILYNRYSGRIYGNILKLIKDKEIAQELLQDVFVKLWEKRESITIHSSFSAYLFVASKYRVYNFIRSLSAEQQVQAYLSFTQTDIYQHVEEDLIAKETEQAIQYIIELLPPKRRDVYKLSKIENKSYDEISQLLGISVSTINDHIVKANRFIKEYLNKSNYLSLLLLSYFFNS